MRMRRGPSVIHTYLWLWFPGIKLVRQQENPIQEKHWQVPRGSQHVCGEDCRQRNQRVGSRQPGQLPVYSQLGRWGKAHKSHIITACHGSVGTFFPTKLEDFLRLQRANINSINKDSVKFVLPHIDAKCCC